MKINKILAAGVAATLAVTSLSAVASAETKSLPFDMETTLGKITYKPFTTETKNITPGVEFKYTADQTFAFKAGAIDAELAAVDTDLNGTHDYRDFDGFVPLIVTTNTANNVVLLDDMGDLKITITGKKLGAIAGTQEPEVQVINLVRVAKATLDGALNANVNYVLPIYNSDAPGDAFLPERFVAIDNIKVEATGAKNVEIAGLGKAAYNTVKTLMDEYKTCRLKANTTEDYATAGDAWVGYDDYAAGHDKNYYLWDNDGDITTDDGDDASDARITIALADGDAAYAGAAPAKTVYKITATAGTLTKPKTLELTGTSVAYADAFAAATKGGRLMKEINSLLGENVVIKWNAGDSATENHMAFLERTTAVDKAIIMRNDVEILSSTNATFSTTPRATKTGNTADGNQSYNDNHLGDAPLYFGGLAGQCADFFNKQNNGKIIFTFTANASTNTWKDGGVPSTEVGLKNSLASTAMALFFNYNQSTGSLVSVGEVDADACTITFDISSILDDMGGLVKGNISDIYYGLNYGLAYKDATYGKDRIGYIVEKVELQYDDAAAAVDATADADKDDDDDAAVVVADDDDDDDVIEDDDIIEDDDDDDDDDAGIIEDDDDDDTDVNNDTDFVDADDDANPGTGVGLAVIPAIVAAAAVVVSKKRK